MIAPNFDSNGIDKTTFAPFTLTDARGSKWKDVRLSFHDWDWFTATYGSDTVEDYYFNGYGVEGLVKAVRLAAGVEPQVEGIDYDSEGDACFVHFSDLEEAVRTAELSARMIKDREELVRMIQVARENALTTPDTSNKPHALDAGLRLCFIRASLARASEAHR